MSSTSGTVRALAEQLAQDDDLRARLVNDPQAVLDEWGIPAGADVVPGTVTLPSMAELAGLVTVSEEPRPRHGPEEPDIHLGEEKPEPEIHFGEEKPEPEIHLGEEKPEPEIHLAEPEIHFAEEKPEPEIHLAEEPEAPGAEPEVHGADADDDEDH